METPSVTMMIRISAILLKTPLFSRQRKRATTEGLSEARREVLSFLTAREAKVLRMRFGI